MFALTLTHEERREIETFVDCTDMYGGMFNVMSELMNSNRYDWNGTKTGVFKCSLQSLQIYLREIKNVWVDAE